uniref:GDNF family receptor alpha-4-like n=1 Tax=Cynoglossus semilaevis TaxID=244447 RepID=A0A3P8UVT1_CYNSE
MIVFGAALLLLLYFSDATLLQGPLISLPSSPLDCVEAYHVCSTEPQCEALYRGLELCAADAAISPLGEQAAAECLERQDVLLSKHPALLSCKCQRGFRREEICLRIYWRVRLLPASSFMQSDGENQCLKAAQDCGLYEKCGSLRSEYVLACTKRVPGSNRCNQHKCHRALRRFLERVPEEYSLTVLFCPCTDTLCGERRRKTIVPSCSYQETEEVQPNCLHQQSFCRRDDLCRSRLADFLNNCQPSPATASGCLKDSAGLCLRAYAGLIGTIMTPNYISNSSAEVSLWCNCEGSGNQWQECLKLQRMFTHNLCLRNSVSWMGSLGSLPDITPPPPRPSPLLQQDNLLNNNNHLPVHNNVVVESEEEEKLAQIEVEEENTEGGQFDLIPLYSEMATVSILGSGGTQDAAVSLNTGPAQPLILLLLVLSVYTISG